MEHRTLLFTEHGSHLYGLNHADSDKDSYRVYLDHSRHSRALQTLEGQDDIFQINLTAFIRQVAKGTPLSLNAMQSTSRSFWECDLDVCRCCPPIAVR